MTAPETEPGTGAVEELCGAIHKPRKHYDHGDVDGTLCFMHSGLCCREHCPSCALLRSYEQRVRRETWLAAAKHVRDRHRGATPIAACFEDFAADDPDDFPVRARGEAGEAERPEVKRG